MKISELPIMAAGLSKMQKGIEEGDEESGLFLAGQCSSWIKDEPTVAELVTRIIAGARAISEATRDKVY